MAKLLRINELFQSIQGESTYAGRRCAFIRLTGCDVGCKWCDTKYAAGDEGRELSLEMIVEAVRMFEVGLVEITGGEPLLQPATPDLAIMLANLGYEVIVETSGSRDISVLPYPVVRIMDIKPPGSGVSDRNRWENLVHLRKGDEVKFVLANRFDYEWAKTIIKRDDFPAKAVNILFSAVTSSLHLSELAGWILADRLEVRLNVQLHKFIWPDIERGV